MPVSPFSSLAQLARSLADGECSALELAWFLGAAMLAAATAPDIAENGAVVPVTVQSGLPKTESIAILIEKNPNMLAANFDLPSGTDPLVGTRVKMGQTSNVYALVKADGKYYTAVKEIKVTLGGCGG